MEVNFFVPAEMIRVATPHLTRSGDTANDDWRPGSERRQHLRPVGHPSLPEHCASKHAFVG